MSRTRQSVPRQKVVPAAWIAVSQLAGQVGIGDRDLPMRTPHHPHRRVPRDAGSRLQRRLHGAPDPRASGWGSGISPARPPARRAATDGWIV